MPLQKIVAVVLLSLLSALAGVPAQAASSLERADALWARRAEGQVAAKAQPEPIGAAIEAYRAALLEEPGRFDAHWKLQRALWFAGDYATSEVAAERARYEEAIAAADDAFDLLAARVGGRDVLEATSPESLREKLSAESRHDAAQLYFWHAVNLGAWARLAGLLPAVRKGVANRMHEATLRSIALDPDVEQGGALRLLSRLHSQLPKVPLLSGWVDHARAIPLAERVVAEYPSHPGNPFLLGLTLLERAPDRRDEALALLARTAALEPRPDHVIEDVAIRITAQEEIENARRTAESDQPPT